MSGDETELLTFLFQLLLIVNNPVMVHLPLCPPSFGFSDSGRPLLILLVSAAGSRLVAANRDGLGEDHGGMAYLYMHPRLPDWITPGVDETSLL